MRLLPKPLFRLLRIQQFWTIEDSQHYWKTHFYLLHSLMGWGRFGDGPAWWCFSGRNAHGDAGLELVNAIWDDDRCCIKSVPEWHELQHSLWEWGFIVCWSAILCNLFDRRLVIVLTGEFDLTTCVI